MKFHEKASLIAGAALLLGACASPPTLYYTLAAPSTPPVAAMPAAAAPLWIEVAPLAVPERLARPQLVVRSAGDATRSQVEILEQHRWASSFENELRDALASGVATRLGALDGTRGGRPASAPVTRIAVQVRQFDAVEDTRVDASFGWTVRRPDPAPVLVCQASLSEPVTAAGIDALALAAQRLAANTAAAIARSMAGPQPNPGCS
ncbi:MAG: membrane integrity-associated transporter subunit PqiC [Variovorax sp.]|nr:MAG: membrane integrity-associated transporter subunit PqiC [Variovorax sp.]